MLFLARISLLYLLETFLLIVLFSRLRGNSNFKSPIKAFIKKKCLITYGTKNCYRKLKLLLKNCRLYNFKEIYFFIICICGS